MASVVFLLKEASLVFGGGRTKGKLSQWLPVALGIVDIVEGSAVFAVLFHLHGIFNGLLQCLLEGGFVLLHIVGVVQDSVGCVIIVHGILCLVIPGAVQCHRFVEALGTGLVGGLGPAQKLADGSGLGLAGGESR